MLLPMRCSLRRMKHPEVFDPKKYSAVGREYVKEYVKSKILVCGSNGKA